MTQVEWDRMGELARARVPSDRLAIHLGFLLASMPDAERDRWKKDFLPASTRAGLRPRRTASVREASQARLRGRVPSAYGATPGGVGGRSVDLTGCRSPCPGCPETQRPGRPRPQSEERRPRHPARLARRLHRPLAAPASRASRSTRSSPRASAATSSRCSAYARQFLGQVDRPDVDFIEGLSPAVSIDQKSTNRNPRSTVGTITEIHDYMRLLWARIGVPHCPECGEVIQRQTVQQIADQLMELPEKHPLPDRRPGRHAEEGRVRRPLQGARGQGLRPRDRRRRADPARRAARSSRRATSTTSPSSSTASSRPRHPEPRHRLGRDGARPRRRHRAGQLRRRGGAMPPGSPSPRSSRCPNGHPLQLTEIEPRTFSFNAPFGACPDVLGPRHPHVGGCRPHARRRGASDPRGRAHPVDHAGQGPLPVLRAAARGPRRAT